MTVTTTYPAHLIFIEVEGVSGPRKWTGRLFRRSACIDVAWKGGTAHPRAVTWIPYFNIVEDPETGKCTATMNGGPTLSSLRYASYQNVTLAQEAGIRWAGRRFRIPTES